MTHHRSTVLRALGALLCGVAIQASAGQLVLDERTPGVAFDGLLDGYPGLAPTDGKADFTGNPLSVVMKTDVCELRSVMEFPLEPLATVRPGAIVAATLEFNVDDVLSTLGPGTELSGRAARRIQVHPYPGDGVAEAADFRRTSETAVAVDTGPGSITDESLRRSGARWFQVDLTARLRNALSGPASHLGVLWRTADSPTGTSLDDGRGGSASGEPSETSAGSAMPRLRVVVSDEDPPLPDSRCGSGGTGAGEPCDDGNACTMADVCDGERCIGTATCGNGVLDPTCGEACDDGNVTPADGCGADCRHDTVVDGTAVTECHVAVAIARPVREGSGAVAAVQSCRDNDPLCDADPTHGSCGFDLAICRGLPDSRVPGCTPPTTMTTVARLAGRAATEAGRQRLRTVTAGLPAAGCSAVTRIDVPLRRGRGRVRPATVTLKIRARGIATSAVDRDVLRFQCLPPA